MTTARAALTARRAARPPRTSLPPRPKSMEREAKAPSQIVGGLLPHGDAAGQPLDPPMRDYFASRMGVDLSPVRIAPDNPALASLGARAMTIGRHIAFATGAFDAKSTRGLQLIGHELVHSVQQQGAGTLPASGSRDAAEREAEQVSGRV